MVSGTSGPSFLQIHRVALAPTLFLREVSAVGPQPRGSHPSFFMVYVSFSTDDLENWKTQNPLCSEKPRAFISLLQTAFNTHQLTWDDCQQLLATLFIAK